MMTPAAEAAAYPPLEVVVARRVRCLRCEYRRHSSCYYRVRHGQRHGHARLPADQVLPEIEIGG